MAFVGMKPNLIPGTVILYTLKHVQEAKAQSLLGKNPQLNSWEVHVMFAMYMIALKQSKWFF